MMHDTTTVNAFSTTAMLRNVSICSAAVDLAVKREIHLPGIVVFHGNSGYGKSTAAAFVANRTKAYYVEVGQNWTRRKFVLAILRQMGMGEERGTVGDLIDKVAEQLALSGRPLIIDEMDSVLEVTGEIIDRAETNQRTVGELRDTYNGHRHPNTVDPVNKVI